MKAQRRHELKTNTLAEAMTRMPSTGLRSTATSIGIVLLGILIGLLIRYRISSGQDRSARAADNLAVVREEIEDIKQMGGGRTFDPTQPETLYRDINSRLDAVIADAGSGYPQLAAEALVARGDAAWNYAGLLSSTTQPSATTQSPSDLLTAAESAYQQVVTNYPKLSFSVDTAHFGLAAIAEDRHDWDTARKEYQAVIDDPSADDLLHNLAKGNLSGLDQLEHPPVIAASSQPTTMTSPH